MHHASHLLSHSTAHHHACHHASGVRTSAASGATHTAHLTKTLGTGLEHFRLLIQSMGTHEVRLCLQTLCPLHLLALHTKRLLHIGSVDTLCVFQILDVYICLCIQRLCRVTCCQCTQVIIIWALLIYLQRTDIKALQVHTKVSLKTGFQVFFHLCIDAQNLAFHLHHRNTHLPRYIHNHALHILLQRILDLRPELFVVEVD